MTQRDEDRQPRPGSTDGEDTQGHVSRRQGTDDAPINADGDDTQDHAYKWRTEDAPASTEGENTEGFRPIWF